MSKQKGKGHFAGRRSIKIWTGRHSLTDNRWTAAKKKKKTGCPVCWEEFLCVCMWTSRSIRVDWSVSDALPAPIQAQAIKPIVLHIHNCCTCIRIYFYLFFFKNKMKTKTEKKRKAAKKIMMTKKKGKNRNPPTSTCTQFSAELKRRARTRQQRLREDRSRLPARKSMTIKENV